MHSLEKPYFLSASLVKMGLFYIGLAIKLISLIKKGLAIFFNSVGSEM